MTKKDAKQNYNFGHGAHVPEDKDQFLVETPYGRGMVIRTRKGDDGKVSMRELELLDWKRAEEATAAAGRRSSAGLKRPATLFSPVDFPSVRPKVDDEVVCQYGRGRVTDIRYDDVGGGVGGGAHKVVVVRISSWRLNGRSLVTCYLSADSVRVVRSKKLYEMSVYEKVEYAQKLKGEAASQFGSREYLPALETYARAVDAVRYVQHKADSSNEVRADLLVLMITCNNNAATCSMQLQRFPEAIRFARNALLLVDALEGKRAGSKILKVLNREGFSDLKLFGEFRAKSFLVMARAHAEKGETDEALDVLKKAHDLIAKYAAGDHAAAAATDKQSKASLKHLLANDKEIKRLHAVCKDRRKAQLKKERQRAQAMFGSSSSPSSSSTSADKDGEEKKDLAEGPLTGSAESSSRSSPLTNGKTGHSKPKSTSPLAAADGAGDATLPSLNDYPSRDGETGGETSKNIMFHPKGDVGHLEELPDNDDEDSAKETRERGTKDVAGEDAADDAEWYKDPDFVIGLGTFALSAIAAGYAVNCFLFNSKR